MLVQVGNKDKVGDDAIEKTKQHLLNLGVPEEAIAGTPPKTLKTIYWQSRVMKASKY